MKRIIILSMLCSFTLSSYSQNIFNKKSKKEGCITGDCDNGQGTYIFGKGEWEGDKYVGEWEDGKLHGQGIYTYADGGKYVGQWEDGKFHGQGTYTYADGKIEKGLWEEDVYANSNFAGMKSVRDTICFFFTKLRVIEFNYQTSEKINETIHEEKYFDVEIKYGDILCLDLNDLGNLEEGESYEKKTFREVIITYFDNTTETEVLESMDNYYFSPRDAIKISVGKQQFKE